MKRVCRSMALVLVTMLTALSVNSQQTPDTKTTDTTATATTKPTTQDYVFPPPRERFKRYVSSTVGPFRLAMTGASAGISQWRDSPEEWGQGMEGYGKRYASSLGQNAVQQTVTYGLDSALHLDTGFEKSKREGFFPRMKDALIQNVTSRTRSGKRVISVPRFAGVYTGAIVATEAWYPDRYDYKDGLRRGTTVLITGFGLNLVREFVFNW
jgi:hypothetical protein